MAASKVDLILDAKNKASGKIKQVGSDLKGLDKAAGAASSGITALAGAASVAAVAGLSAMAFEMTSTAKQFEAISVAGRRMAAENGDSLDMMLAAMKEASAGMINETDLILAANKAMTLGVASSTEDLVALMNLAAERGPALGLSMAQAFDDLVTGLGRGSALILDNLGIVMDLNTVNKEYADSVGKTVQELTEAEKKQALVNSVLSEAKGNTELIIDPTQQAAAAWKGFRTQLALMVTEGGAVPGVLNAITGALNGITDTLLTVTPGEEFAYTAAMLEKLKGENEELNRIVESSLTPMFLKNQYLQKIAANEELITELQQRNAQSALDMANAAGQYYGGADKLAQDAIASQEALEQQVKATTDALNALQAKSESVKASITSSLMSGATDFVGGDAVAGYNIAREKSVELETQLAQIALANNISMEDANKYILPELIAGQTDLWREATKTSSAVAQISDEYRNLQSAVDSVLSEALDVGVGDAWREGLPRPEAVNEDARRLADVAVQGFASPWAKYFQDTFPDLWGEMTSGGDIQSAAAEILNQFEQGLRPELIDKETAKERVRKMIMGDANLAELAREITNELAAEMGVSAETIRGYADSVLGTNDTSTAGTDASSAFGDGAVSQIKEAQTGAIVVGEFLAQIRENFETIKTEGKNAGKEWGGGFLETVRDGVPAELVSLLTDLVTPGVMANLSQYGTLTGADQ